MPANRFNGFTDYGIGIGLRIPHYDHILNKKPAVDWFEIISENYMMDGGRPLAVLDQILEQYRVVQHGVSMYFGSAERLNRDHMRRLKALVKRGRPVHARPSSHAIYVRSGEDHGSQDPRGPRFSGSSHRGRERQQLRRVSHLRNDRM